MAVMDPCAFDLLSRPPLAATAFSGCGNQPTAEFDDTAIGAVPPPLPSAVRFPSTTPVHYDSVELPATCELYGAALDAQLFHLAIEVPAADSKNKNSTTRPRLPDYDADIDVNLRKMEKDANQRPSPDYLKTLHGDPKSQSTRARLVFLMEEVTLHFDLAPGTLHRAVSYIDRVLSGRTLLLTHMEYAYVLRLLGATAVYTAAKYEEQRTRFKVNAAGIAAYCGFATGKEVIDMELSMLAALKYELSGPTAYTFVDHFTRHSKGDQDLEVQRLAHRLAATSLISYRLLQLLPSAVAASAVFLASLILNSKAIQVRRWNKDFEELTGYRPTDLILGIESLCMMNPHPRLEILPVFLQDE